MKFLDRTYHWFLLLPVFLPFIIWNKVLYPYLVPKTLLFYAISILSLVGFVLLAARGRAFYFGRLTRPASWIPVVLLFIAYGTSALGVDFYRSFWSLFIRGDGLLMLTCVVASFYLILLSADKAFFERFLRLVGLVASAVALYGIGEWIIEGGSRVGGLLGNSAFFAGYLGIAFFVTLLAARTYRGSERQWLYCGAVVQIVAIILSATRGTMLALTLAGVVYLITHAFSKEENDKVFVTRGRATGTLLVLVLLGAIFVTQREYFANSSFAPIARIASMSLAEADVANRLFAWQGMLSEIQKRPWTGAGAEHIDILFNRIYDPTKISEQWFDRAHNAFLDYAAQYGIFGLLAYLALIGLCFSAAWRARAQGDREGATIFVLLGITYGVQNFFVFDTISSFWLFIALLAFTQISKEDVPISMSSSSFFRRTSLIISIVLVSALMPATMRPLIAAYAMAHAYTYQVTDVEKSIQYLEHGLKQGTYGDIEYGYFVYDMYVHIQMERLTGEAQARAYETATSILTENFYQYSYDARTALYLAQVLDSAPEGVTVDREIVLSALERAIRLSPKRAQSWLLLTNLAIENANKYPPESRDRMIGYSGAYDLLAQYIALVPTFSMPYFVRADLLDAMGEPVQADADAALGKAQYKPDEETARRATGYYIRKEAWTDAEFFLDDIVRFAPEDFAARYDLAKVKYLLGKYVEAVQIVQELRERSPETLLSDQVFLEAIAPYENR